MLKKQPKMLILDEFDRAVQEDLAVLITQEILKHAKITNMIVFMTAHFERVKNLPGLYTHRITTSNGTFAVKTN